MIRTESKRKNRPSLDLSEAEVGSGSLGGRTHQHEGSMYSVASGVEEEEEEEESGDQTSPLRSEMDAAEPSSPVEGVDISGGIGTPVYIVNMDNMFEQDAILGKAKRQPGCLSKLLCGANSESAVKPAHPDPNEDST